MTAKAIPVEDRSISLQTFLKDMSAELLRLRNTDLADSTPYVLSLHSLVFPWLVDSEFRSETTERAKQLYKDHDFNGKEIIARLHTILREDKHLEECCVNEITLAQALSPFVNTVADYEGRSDEDLFDTLFSEFADFVYAEPFVAYAYSHLFNFSAFHNNLDFNGFRIQELPNAIIPLILGEKTEMSFLHPLNSGNYFIISEFRGVLDINFEWLKGAHETAQNFVRVAQYFKDGVVHLNYTAPLFSPYWVNSFRKPGAMFFGFNRRLSYEYGTRMYSISDSEYAELRQWWQLFCAPDIAAMFGDERNSFGDIIGFAGGYYESSHTQIEKDRRLVDLAIALEAGFSPHNDGEISFQLSQLIAQFVGFTSQEKREIFEFVRKMYDKRSKLLHGHSKAFDDEFIKLEDLESFSSVIRRGLLKLIALYIDGEENHKSVIKKIRESLFDPDLQSVLHEKSNIRRLIEERVGKEQSDSH